MIFFFTHKPLLNSPMVLLFFYDHKLIGSNVNIPSQHVLTVCKFIRMQGNGKNDAETCTHQENPRQWGAEGQLRKMLGALTFTPCHRELTFLLPYPFPQSVKPAACRGPQVDDAGWN